MNQDVSIKLASVSELSEADQAEVRALSLAIYPPQEASTWPGRHMEWARPDWCVRVWASGGELASYVGILLREATHDTRSVVLGGVGGVGTHPAARRKGYAERGLRLAIDFFRKTPQVAFALLVCEETLLPYYSRLGWHTFGGEVIVRQHGQPAVFTFNRVMTHSVASVAALDGVIDLCGPPW